MELIELSNNFVEEKTSDIIWVRVEKYIKYHAYELRNQFSFCGSSEDLTLSDVVFKTVFFYDLPGSMFKISILIEAVVSVEHYYRNDDKIEDKPLWFQVVGESDVNNKLSDFKIITFEKLESVSKFPSQLTRTLCPIIHREDYEAEAEKFLKKYYKEALFKPTKVDPLLIVSKMKLTYIEENIAKDNSIFGQIHFFKNKAKLFDYVKGEYYEKEVDKGTIIVDPDAFFLYNEGSKNNTIIHECVHWWKHRKAIYLQHMYNKKAKNINCDVLGVQAEDDLLDKKYMEIQANALAPRILMPYNMFKQYALKALKVFTKGNPGVHQIDVMEQVIDSCAKFFGVSRLSAKIRMVDIGILSAIGTYNYVDGHYVRPHAFAKGSINLDETYTISFIDGLLLSFANSEIKELIDQGVISFVENHFVINTPDAITTNSKGHFILTEEARLHMDKYCLKFKMIPEEVKFKSNDVFLNRDINSKIQFRMEYPKKNGRELTPSEKLALIMKEEKKHIKESMMLPRDYKACLDFLKKEKHMSATDIAVAIGIDDRIVRRMISGERDGSLVILTLILHAFGCEPDAAHHIIELSPFKSDSTMEEYQLCRFFINNMHNQSLDEIISIIKEASFIPEKNMPKFI